MCTIESYKCVDFANDLVLLQLLKKAESSSSPEILCLF